MCTLTLVEDYSPEFTPGADGIDVILEKVGICWCFDVIEALSVISVEEDLRGES